MGEVEKACARRTTESAREVERVSGLVRRELQGSERGQCSEVMEESVACEGEGGVADGTAPVALDGVGGTPSAGEE